MSLSDFLYVLQWWGYLFVIGLIFFPLVSRIFSGFIDKGYPFAKIVGAAILSYVVFILGVTHLLPFTQVTIFISAVLLAILMTLFLLKSPTNTSFTIKGAILLVLEELLFLGGLLFWTHIRSYQPDIFGLEKYMDFGFVNSILRSTYFPPKDMWYTPFPINYYYFGHLITAVLTKLSNIPSFISFNLMLATLFSFTFTLSFSIVGNIWSYFMKTKNILRHQPKTDRPLDEVQNDNSFFTFIPIGIIGGFLVTLGGNLHTIYTLFIAYPNDSPVPFWQLLFAPKTFPNNYWYPNATRFIFHTIHEFPSYSFVVSDLHGHVLDIPMVLTTIAILFAIATSSYRFSGFSFRNLVNRFSAPLSNKQKIDKLISENRQRKTDNRGLGYLILLSFCLAVMYMTNAWDGMIYFLLSAVILFWKNKKGREDFVLFTIYNLLLILGCFFIFSLPFSLFFNPGALVGGIGLICAPDFLIHIGKIGPFIFESNRCMHSPLWQLGILYGFFLFWSISFLIICIKQRKKLTEADVFIVILTGVALFLIVVPEFFYLRDIYTTYFRANTMFKLVYQAFILFSLSAAFMIGRFLQFFKTAIFWKKLLLLPYFCIGIFFFVLVGMYSYFAVNSYYGNLAQYKGLNGLTYLSKSYPSDALGIFWLNQHVNGQPVILEAQGDSYTEYARVSSNTGLPTVLGWPVHEWLWRGTYDIVPPRSNDVQTMYETPSSTLFLQLAKKYHVQYVFVGQLERTKYTTLNEEKFQKIGRVVFHEGVTTIYQVSS